MSLNHSLLAASYQPVRITNALLRQFGIKSQNRLRVLLYHDIAPDDYARFAAQLTWLARTWHFVAPQDFADMMQRERPIEGGKLLLTFDDGFASNRLVAEEVLNPMGIQALFFVVSDFVGIATQEDCRQFIARHICPGMNPAVMPGHWRNMSWPDLRSLVDKGHTIGAHTRTHARLSTLTDDRALEDEIINSADRLEQQLGIKVEHFAFTFGDLASFSPAALTVARRRFSFIYTGLRGENAGQVPAWAIRRDSMQAKDPLPLVGAFLEGGADHRYTRHVAAYERWGGNG